MLLLDSVWVRPWGRDLSLLAESPRKGVCPWYFALRRRRALFLDLGAEGGHRAVGCDIRMRPAASEIAHARDARQQVCEARESRRKRHAYDVNAGCERSERAGTRRVASAELRHLQLCGCPEEGTFLRIRPVSGRRFLWLQNAKKRESLPGRESSLEREIGTNKSG